MAEFESMRLEIDDQIAVVTLLRDTYSMTFPDELCVLFSELSAQNNVRVVLIKNDGRFFCAGGDVKSTKPMTPLENKNYIASFGRAVRMMNELPKPIIALVNGAAAGGGCNFALAADFVIVSEKAKFVQSFVNVNCIPDTGGLYTLMRYVGLQKAKELCMTARKVGAQEAVELGLALKAVSSEELLEEGMRFAKELASKPPVAIAYIKKIANAMPELNYNTYSEIESSVMAVLGTMQDSREGGMAFIEKREPVFKGE